VTARRQGSLFRSLALSLGVALAATSLLTAGIIAWQVTWPLGKRVISDLGALMILSAQTWVELPPETRADFELELLEVHGLRIGESDEPQATAARRRPYLGMLQQELAARSGEAIPVYSTAGPELHWADIPVGDETVRVGFAHERIGVEPPLAVALLLLVILLLSLAAAVILARRMALPLERLSEAAERVGSGETPRPLPETGPRELALLARRFNHMARDVRALLANRTTLLAGISHDLRTPLARMRLAIEMLHADADSKLLAALERDSEEMERLIRQFLELGGGLEREHEEEVDLAAITTDCAKGASHVEGTVQVRARGVCPCRLNALAFRRVLTNLIENALRYGAGSPVEVIVECGPPRHVISVLDRGPGIPAAAREKVFQPFYRLEPSRSTATGGSGLGLAVAKQLADAHGWRLELRERPGGGTEARVELSSAP
jgi:two-component system, OmpR family, osmolarity sensor histidine kinase EnvZ